MRIVALRTVDPLRTATPPGDRMPTSTPRQTPTQRRGALARAALMLAVLAVPLTACAPAPDVSGGAAGSASPSAATSAPTGSLAPVPPSSGQGTPSQAAPHGGSPGSAAPDPSRTFPAEGTVPARLDIPSLDLTDDLIDLGIEADGSMQVPEDWQQTGWFTGGGKPGGRGPTVLAGHVDSPTGPAVFARLNELAAGDEVRVTDVAGTVHTYVVTEVSSHAKADFPTADVFGVIPRDELRLITCGGIFDQASGHYEDNLVVHAVKA